jgi:hypothetical protein
MGLASIVGVAGSALGSRFSLVSLFPTAAGTLVVAFVVAAGAPAQEPSWDAALETARAMDGSDVALLVVAVTAVSVLLQPLQLQTVRLLEGYWGDGLLAAWLSRPLLRHHHGARQRLEERAALDADATVVSADAAVADQVLHARYPSGPLLPTALGNVLRAAERGAGRRYGLDAVVLWPRLYPLLPDRLRVIVEDLRDQLDVSVRLSATFAAVAVVTAALLWRFPLWWLVPLAALLLALMAYRASVAAAVAYGESLRVSFDLHRFDLLRALHLPLPADPQAEVAANRRLSTSLRQGGPAPPGYEHPAVSALRPRLTSSHGRSD